MISFLYKWKVKNDLLDFCNKSLFFDYEADDIIKQINQLLLCFYTEFNDDMSKNTILKTSFLYVI